ncbi:helix-turn-helix domain-containing protein [Gilvirhabdus luticola]|uniref:helix-turn-helix domain-containing protein n=1 Tax=Gilvirhabdus luticola TaxID=3079858 RepID=UPI003919759A
MNNPFQEIFDKLCNIEKQLQGYPSHNNIKDDNQNELLSKKQACALLGISYSTLWRWTQQRRIQAYGLNNRVYYKRSEIMATIKKIN